MKIQLILTLLIIVVVAGILGTLYVVEEKKIAAKESELFETKENFRREMKEKDMEIMQIKNSSRREIAEAIAAFSRDMIATRNRKSLILSVNQAIMTLPLDEIVIMDARGYVLATSNLKFSDATLEDKEIQHSLEKGEGILSDGTWYLPIGTEGNRVGVVRIK